MVYGLWSMVHGLWSAVYAMAEGWMLVTAPVGSLLIRWDERGLRDARWLLEARPDALPWTIEEVQTLGRTDPWARFLRDWWLAYRTGQWSETAALAVFDHMAPGLLGSAFQEAVLRTVVRIPMGSTRTYRAVAEAVGKPSAARAVGQVLARNPLPVLIPCHRVVGHGGRLGGYTPSLRIKAWLLEWERSFR
ncbi:Methylated-DNA--protein-cysteine methyltransferase, constitutive [bacterium HR11]|nr:Methylated-DNA--protein-cysteine methyltransferase, constitutive [bacterium HR11]